MTAYLMLLLRFNFKVIDDVCHVAIRYHWGSGAGLTLEGASRTQAGRVVVQSNGTLAGAVLTLAEGEIAA